MSALARGKEIEAAVETLPPTTAGPLAVGGRIGEVAQSLGASWARLGRGLAAPYLLALFSVIAAGLIGWLRWSNSLYFFGDLKYASGTGQGAMTVVSSLMLGAAGALFLVVARELGRERQQAISVTWLSFASLAVVLALDEVLMAHEYASYRMASYGVPEVLGLIDQDIFVFIGYGVVLMMVLWCALPTILRFGTAVLPLVPFGSFMVGSQMVDFVPWTRLSRFEQQVLGPAEEGLKTLGAFSLLVYAFVLTLDVIDWRVRRGQSRG